jgi:hypothetical protein
VTTTAPARVAEPAVPGSDIKLGLTLYSLTSEWAAGRYDLRGLLDTVADAGIGPGIEIVASQTIRTYPEVTDEFVREWRDAFDRHGFVPSSFGCNLDMGRRRDRDMTPDEEFEFTATQFRSARALGFPLVRIQSAKPELIRRLLPLAEELDLTMGWELHAPLGPNSPKVLEIRETYAEMDSPRLGFVADFSATMHAMSPTILRKLAKMGLGPTPTSTRGTASSSSTCTPGASRRRASGRSPGWPSTCTGTSTRPSGPTSCRRSSTCTPSSTTSTSTATSRRSTTRRSSGSSSAAATPASSPASGRATPSPTSTRPTPSTWSASSTT